MCAYQSIKSIKRVAATEPMLRPTIRFVAQNRLSFDVYSESKVNEMPFEVSTPSAFEAKQNRTANSTSLGQSDFSQLQWDISIESGRSEESVLYKVRLFTQSIYLPF